MSNCEGPWHVSEEKRKAIHTLDHAFKLLGCEGHLSFPASLAQSILTAVNTEIKSDKHIRNYIRLIVAKKVNRECSRRLLQAAQKAVKNAFVDLFITGTAEVKCELKNTL